jgi:hypothetical protein
VLLVIRKKLDREKHERKIQIKINEDGGGKVRSSGGYGGYVKKGEGKD